MRYPLTWQDQSVLFLERTSDPWNIQLELGVDERIDRDRLEAALLAGCRRHPIASSRVEFATGLGRFNHWVPMGLDQIEVHEATSSSPAELDEIRTAFYSPPFDLEVAPPFKVMVVRREDGDLLLFNAAHPAVDGIGLLRLLSTITAHYRGDADTDDDPLPLTDARNLQQVLKAADAGEWRGRALEGGRKLIGALKNPARIAPDGNDSRNAAGFAHRVIPADAVKAISAAKPEGTTLNDVLLGAVSMAVQRWNADHGANGDKVQVFMPVNVRPAEWSTDVVSNMFSYVSISTTADQRSDLASATLAARAQTEPVNRAARAGGTQDLLKLLRPLPVAVKRQMPHLLTLTGHRFVDTVVVSNLGRPAVVPSLQAGPPSEIQFTPPYWSAAAVSVGAVSSEGRLHLGVRHRLNVLGRDAGERFADLLVDILSP